MRIRDHIFNNAVPARRIGVDEAIVESACFGVFDLMFEIAALFVAKGFAVSNEELKVTCVGAINVRIINFVDDSVAEREPDATAGVVSGADAFFGAASPARLDSRSAESR